MLTTEVQRRVVDSIGGGPIANGSETTAPVTGRKFVNQSSPPLAPDQFGCVKPVPDSEQAAIVEQKRAAWKNGEHVSFTRTRFVPGVTVEQASRVLMNLVHFSDDQFHKAVITGDRLDAKVGVQFDMRHTNWPMIWVHDASKVHGIVTRWAAGGAGAPCYQTLLELQICGAPTPDHEQAMCVKAVPGGVDITWRVTTKPLDIKYPPPVHALLRRWVSFHMGRAIERKVNLLEGRIERQELGGKQIRTGLARWFQHHVKPLLAYTPLTSRDGAPPDIDT